MRVWIGVTLALAVVGQARAADQFDAVCNVQYTATGYGHGVESAPLTGS